jgi:hypothetical protein
LQHWKIIIRNLLEELCKYLIEYFVATLKMYRYKI